MSRIVAVIWHASFSILAGIAYFLFVLPRWWELSGDWSHTLGTVMRIVAGALIGLAALPVVFTWLRTRRPEYGTPELALRLRLCSIVLHALAGVLIVGTAISEIWFSLDEAGRWLFGIYGAAAAIGLLGIFSFYLAFVAELPPPPPRPVKEKRRKRRWRRRKGKEEPAGEEADEAEEQVPAEERVPAEEQVPAEAEEQVAAEEAEERTAPEAEADKTGEAEGAVTVEKKDETADAASETADTEADEKTSDEGETPAAEDTLAAEPARGGLRNRRSPGKIRRPRLRRKSGGVAVEE
jgi:hypothetical protein